MTLEKENQTDFRDLSGSPVVKNLPANAEDTDSFPGLGRFHVLQGNKAHVVQLLSLCILEHILCSKRSHQNGKPTQCNERIAPACHK